MRVFSAFSAGRGASGVDAVRRRNLLAVSLASFLASVGFTVGLPLLPGLVRDVLAEDVGQVGLWLGLAISVSPLLTALSGPFWAALGERYGHKAMIQRSLLCIGVGIGLLAVAQSVGQVVAIRAMIGGLGGVSVAALAAISATMPRRELGPAVGTLQASQTAGAMVGPLIGGALGGWLGLREAFLASGAVFAGALGLVQWLYREAPPAEATPKATTDDGGGFGAGMAVAFFAAFALQFVEGGFIVLLPVQLERLGAAPDSLPWLLGLGLSGASLAATIMAAVGGRAAGAHSSTKLLRLVLILGVVALVPLAFAQTWWQLLGLRVLLALAVGAAPTLAYSAAASLAPPERRGRMVSLVSSAGIFGWAASPLTAGALVQVDPTYLLGLDAALYALAAAALLAVERGLPGRIRRPSLGRVLPTLLPVGGARAEGGRRDSLLAGVGLVPHRRTAKFSADEVGAVLRGTDGPRAKAILAVASRSSSWMPSDPRPHFGEAAKYAERLPMILHQYRRGESPEAIGRRLSPFGGAWTVNRTVDVAAKLIAEHLNRR